MHRFFLRLAVMVTLSFISTQTVSYADSISSVYHYHGRPYILDLSSQKHGSQQRPLIIVLHGATGNARSMKRSIAYDMRQEIEKHGFMVAYISGSLGRFTKKRRTWNAGACCGPAERQNTNDLGYIAGFIKHVQKKHKADPKRIYLMGYSNGAMMAYRYICEKPGEVAAIVAISGTLMADKCSPKGLKGILHIHGGEDFVVPVEGGISKVGLFRRDYYTPVSDIKDLMQEAGVPFKFLFLENTGHKFEETNSALNIPRTAWRFLRDFKK